MSQMAPTLTASDFRPRHAKRAIRMARHRTGDAVKVGWPAAAGFELVRRAIEGRLACGASVDAVRGHVLVEFAGVGRFGAFFSDDAELFCLMVLLVSIQLRGGWEGEGGQNYQARARPAIRPRSF